MMKEMLMILLKPFPAGYVLVAYIFFPLSFPLILVFVYTISLTCSDVYVFFFQLPQDVTSHDQKGQVLKGHMPIVHGTYANEEEDEVIVKTEFVWADGAENDVKLSGSWNGWMTIQMYHEGGGMWSVVTPVPVGSHEFKFVVDGEWKHSTRHPTVGDDPSTMNNLRVVRGPPKAQRLEENRRNAANASQSERSQAKKSCCVIC